MSTPYSSHLEGDVQETQTDNRWCFFHQRRQMFSPSPWWKTFSQNPERSTMHKTFRKADLSSSTHMGNQMLPSFPTQSYFPFEKVNVCRSLSRVWNYSPGRTEKRQQATESLKSTAHSLLYLVCLINLWIHLQTSMVYYELLPFKQFLIVNLGNNFVTFWRVLHSPQFDSAWIKGKKMLFLFMTRGHISWH